MTEHEDQIAQYRLKLEETAALVARIRHEINNPLTGVLGQAQLLLREDLSERSRKRVQTIEDLALRLRDVVAQLRSAYTITYASNAASASPRVRVRTNRDGASVRLSPVVELNTP